MNILTRVDVEGFWGTKTFSIELHRDVNFLIGVNGSGKTTLINMVAAALSADLQMLERLPFEKLTIHMEDVDSRRKPFIEVEKKPNKDLGIPRVTYRIREGSSETLTVYDLDEVRQVYGREHVVYRERMRRAGFAIVEHLKGLVNLSWLSIHRSQTSGPREDRSFESTVDKKLDQIATELVKYFSLLTRQSEVEQAKFQKAVFLSLIAQQPLSPFTEIGKLDLKGEDAALVQIFEQFKLQPTEFAPLVEDHFAMVKSALNAIKSGTGYNTAQLSAVVAMSRIHSVVQEWHAFVEKQQGIYASQGEFLGILNRLSARKSYGVSEKNELTASITDSGTKLSLTELSSGEKQLLIILAETLLQQKTAWIYIADEPELSLHVDWQVKLITNLLSLNPMAQILFATHSPDIVSSYGTRVFSVEDILI